MYANKSGGNETISRRREGRRLRCRGAATYSAPRADRPPGTMPPSRYRTGIASDSPSLTSSLTDALPGSRHISLQETVQRFSATGGALHCRCLPKRAATRAT